MKMKFEYQELENFADELTTQSRDQEMKRVMDELIKNFLGEAMNYTPVVTGNMRLHWDLDNRDYKVRKVRNGYSVTVYNKAKNEYGYKYASDVDQGHQSYNQYGGPYTVYNSKYGANGGPVIGRFIIDKAYMATHFQLEKPVALELQKWLDRCVENAK
jgi:hypothetical protein